MSIAALNWAFALPVRGPAKAVLVALADHANEAGTCFPSIERLCLFSGFQERAVRLALRELEASKLVSISRVRGMISVYALSLKAAYTPASDAAPPTPNPGTSCRTTPASRATTPAPHAGTPASRAPEPLLTPIEPPREPSRVSIKAASGFEEFWDTYPRKVGKGAARKAWLTSSKKADEDEILEGLGRAKFSDDQQYIPHPATWLNQERWSDVVDTRDPTLVAVGFYDDEPAAKAPPQLRLVQ